MISFHPRDVIYLFVFIRLISLKPVLPLPICFQKKKNIDAILILVIFEQVRSDIVLSVFHFFYFPDSMMLGIFLVSKRMLLKLWRIQTGMFDNVRSFDLQQLSTLMLSLFAYF